MAHPTVAETDFVRLPAGNPVGWSPDAKKYKRWRAGKSPRPLSQRHFADAR